VLVTNDYSADPATLESEHRHKAQVESGVRKLKEKLRAGRLQRDYPLLDRFVAALGRLESLLLPVG